MQRFLFQLFWLVSVLMSEQEVLQNQPVLKLLLLLYAANNNRHLWITRVQIPAHLTTHSAKS